jgi:hypothetical protein
LGFDLAAGRAAACDAGLGDLARRGLLLRQRPPDETVILEGLAEPVLDAALERRVDEVYGPKYDLTPDSSGETDPWFVVRPKRVYAWTEHGYPGSATQFDCD